ncbi:hypothetical protein HBN50_16275 [Halobacteriovorax sp. GB3]|uniref:hypothetical protein n=1 Tax=Halobacteriovorax sp. GB3 TaxID=2719615 RepID=UPI002362C7D1|nr:hypothetical protein [Halobacteriovorax sp. GB3]MDD0854671.1 hypothetical protein [Halobacteriovorax sp. GB3]
MNKDQFLSSIEDYFENVVQLDWLDDFAIIFARRDGVPLYSQSSFSDDIEKDSIGALVSGVWQAARSLVDFLPADDESDIFRLSFDTSSRGIYLLPVMHKGDEYQLGIIYRNMVNPGAMKSKLRIIRNELELFLDEVFNGEEESLKEDYLFEDITDDEMDNLFSFGN